MPIPKFKIALLAALPITLAGCGLAPAKKPIETAPSDIAAETNKRTLPNQELTAQTLYQYLVGEIALQRNQPELAAEALLDLAKNSRDPRLAQRATETAIQGRQATQAADAATLWQALEPDSPQAIQAAAALLLNSGRLVEARPYLEKIIAGGEESRASGFLHLNQMLGRQRNREAVLELVRHLASAYPESVEGHYAVAQAAWNASRRDEALSELSQAENLRPGWEPAALFHAQILQQSSNAETMDFLRDFLRQYPKSKDVRLTYARLLVNEKLYTQARAEFQHLMNNDPGNPDAAFAIGLLALQEGDLEAADHYLRQALTGGHKDGDTVRFYLGQAAEESKRWDEAATWYGSVERGEQYLNARIRHAGLMSKQGKLTEARHHLHQTRTQQDRQRALLIQAEAQLLREAKLYQETFDVLGKGLEKQPDQPDLLYDHAMAAEKLDLLDIMEKDLRRLIQLQPDNAHAYNALGYSLADRNLRLDEARELVEKAAELKPEDPFIMDSLGWTYFRLGQHVRAIELLRRAHALGNDPEIAAHLGEVLWTQGQHDEARKVWQSALKRAPENEVLRNVMHKHQ